jgi:hypothetical protein
MILILIIVLIILAAGSHPRWSHAQNWGYYPSGGLGLVALIVILLLLTHHI